MVFVKEESEEDMSEPEPWRIKHEEQGWCLFFILRRYFNDKCFKRIDCNARARGFPLFWH